MQFSDYEAFVKRHWGVHPKTGPAPDPKVAAAVSDFACGAGILAVMISAKHGNEINADTFIATMGLLGETGEVVEHLKKHVRDGVLDRAKLRLELSDLLFYMTRLCQSERGKTLDGGSTIEGEAGAVYNLLVKLIETLGYAPEEIAQANVEKLEARYGKR